MKQYKKRSTNNTKHSKYKYTFYQNTQTYTHSRTTKQVRTNTVNDISSVLFASFKLSCV